MTTLGEALDGTEPKIWVRVLCWLAPTEGA